MVAAVQEKRLTDLRKRYADIKDNGVNSMFNEMLKFSGNADGQGLNEEMKRLGTGIGAKYFLQQRFARPEILQNFLNAGRKAHDEGVVHFENQQNAHNLLRARDGVSESQVKLSKEKLDGLRAGLQEYNNAKAAKEYITKFKAFIDRYKSQSAENRQKIDDCLKDGVSYETFCYAAAEKFAEAMQNEEVLARGARAIMKDNTMMNTKSAPGRLGEILGYYIIDLVVIPLMKQQFSEEMLKTIDFKAAKEPEAGGGDGIIPVPM
ncbi:MAG: hypothetical protein COB50_03075 [Thiotrichales bacterium]|nr:MAG: hypothetical protein COB50_03075 [Thiotrichales bacterium]